VLLSTCSSCGKWLLRKETSYENGEVIVNWSDPEGRGECSYLSTCTHPSFGCNQYMNGGPLIERASKPGEPWHHWVLGPCPECHGLGTGGTAGGYVDNRCCGTGLVQYYDDGYVGDNKTKCHPKEKALYGKKRDEVELVCFNCQKPTDPSWLMCPYCATKLKEPKSEPPSALVA